MTLMVIVAVPLLFGSDANVETRLCGKKTCLHLGQIKFTRSLHIVLTHT
ncbi:MAG: hypothetical protein OEW84_01695 [Aigarchaeota archaeon]|nr:hypothetical protein [Aigarchaeota archaeon]